MNSLVESSAAIRHDYGRQKIELAEEKLMGIMIYRISCASKQPFQGARITLMVPTITPEVAVLLETISAFCAKVHVCSSDRCSPIDDEVAAAIACDDISVFAKKDQSLEEHPRFMEKALDWGSDNPDVIICHGSDASHFICEGLKAEEVYKKTGKFPDPSSGEDEESQIILTVIRDALKMDPNRFHKIIESCQINDENKQIVAAFELFYPKAVKVRWGFDDTDRRKFTFMDSEVPALHFWLHKVPDLVVQATNGNIAGMKVVVWGYVTLARSVAMHSQTVVLMCSCMRMVASMGMIIPCFGPQIRSMKILSL
ncbi:adenosylhomocysteinase-like [Prosopis cineraria]|uniref:adenosylhomocysteinase-like n=1 Tax=Prosopis cineraria TaxID=364024 RepID=UPI00241072F5|nr:adenosylhomocysteinase-like [Prosopis cineraria]